MPQPKTKNKEARTVDFKKLTPKKQLMFNFCECHKATKSKNKKSKRKTVKIADTPMPIIKKSKGKTNGDR